MKTRRPFPFVASLAFVVAALAASASATRAQTDAPRAATPVVTSHEFLLQGEVIARNELGFTVLSRGSELQMVRVSRTTSIKKGAETIRLADVMVGDKVSVTLKRGADGNLLAVDVAVRTGFEPQA
ncbi:hypothetical protein [Opitutus terrae]|uniref:DUF5666 domain-containing protein n=1 Tax=Opitutus terrae (strain DSM 11246 / JCM 15787 / PB90-1) TaxID=452637 RepID=B1ZUU5_OPITP|nr:hypothetical protein [Opitutus terrae]ACB74977.1 hypothetical protein Oter_1693 [Opitutus terrae PB90-1]